VLHVGVDPNRASTAVRGWLRLSYVVGQGLARIGVRPATVTLLGLLLSLAVPLAAWYRGVWFFAAAGLVFLSAVADSADGAVAVITGRTTRLGTFSDSMADRLSEAAWLVGLWLVGGHGVLVTVCGALAWLHEYARARAAVAGMGGVAVITVAERPTRVIAAIAGFMLGGIAWSLDPGLTPGAVTVAVAFWAILGLIGTARLVSAIRTELR
jgi:CDP-diacylglycerol--glycerol-3-phosphate 3-phosphatidyltransferase